MIGAVSNTASVHTDYDNTRAKSPSASAQIAPTDAVTTTIPKDFMAQMSKFRMAAKNNESKDTDSIFRNASEVYAKELASIKAKKLSEADEMKKISALNQVFEMHLKSQATAPVFRIESTETMNMGYAKFLKNNLDPNLAASDDDRTEDQGAISKSKYVLNNHKNNADYLADARNTLEKYTSDFYSEFINSITKNGFESAYEQAIGYSKNNLAENGTSYDQLQNTVHNELHKIHDKGYWYDYDSDLNRTTKHAFNKYN